MTDPNEIAILWRQKFGSVSPIGYRCRAALPDRWLRIHSLPGSKRYPGTSEEFDELLRRHHLVSNHVLGEAAACTLFVGRYASEAQELPNMAQFERLPSLDDTEESLPIHVFGATVTWEAHRFDALIRSVADDDERLIFFANLKKGTGYAPYDGGADLFFASPQHVGTQKQAWAEWTSPRKDGL